jgi:hypothetical protein
MCTVTYIPLPGGVLLSSNRDEDPGRKRALPPAIHSIGGSDILFPRDGEANGTWIAINSHGDFVVLLNGGFVKHERKAGAYRYSRGIIVRDMMASAEPVLYWKTVNLYNIEPFTLVVYSGQLLYHFTWTGFEKITSTPETNKIHMWSSATLYDEVVRQKREAVFKDYYLKRGVTCIDELKDFLMNAMKDDVTNGYVMNRDNEVKTCSISLVELQQNIARFQYLDLLEKTVMPAEFILKLKLAANRLAGF